MGRREQKRAESVDRLLDAAESLFLEHGIANVGLEKVAAAAGLTRGAIYWNFADKEDLALAVISRRRRRDLESWQAAVDTGHGGGRHLTSLREWIDGLLQAGPSWFAFEAEALALAARRGASAAARETQQVMLSQFEQLLLRECQALGVPAPADVKRAAELVAALANGLVLAWLVEPSLPVASLFADGVVRLLGSESVAAATEGIEGAAR